MSNCCQCQGIENTFNAKLAADDLADYRRDGPSRTTTWLLNALQAEGVAGMTLLDVGGGVGAIQLALLQNGVRSVTAVDASSAYLQAAQQEAERQQVADRIQYLSGDFVDLSPQLETADIVTLDRVICCYHDMEGLVTEAAAHTDQLLGLIFPRDRWWLKQASRLPNFGLWMMRNPFRIFVHPTTAVEDILHRYGFQRRYYDRTWLWQVILYGK
ncbi:MAG: methyltransferase domain-containing protein [Chloroflexi bacterium]|nr:methyltransferase domain-containing protein [Chloroflexota bacterium]